MGDIKEYKTDIRFNNIQCVHRFLGRIANECYKGTLSTDRTKTLGYIANIMIKSIEIKDIEKRLDELESNANSKAG